MILSGLQKSTLIDYPGKIACVVFTAGCNLRCGFCHNPEMVIPSQIQANQDAHISEKVFFNFLDRRRGLLDGVSICGGEPTIHPDLPDFCQRIKKKGFLVKLDTNGKNPDMIARLIRENLVDYFAMDIKHTWEGYPSLVGVSFEKEKYEKSIKLIINQAKDYEFRSTVIEGVHTENDIREMASYIAGAKKYYIQNYRDSITLDPSFIGHSFHENYLKKFQEIALESVKECKIRL
ncbi:anaerobic ribonucleoside-triphosphate reductase activating protein [Candidatus Gracilibacteria bacterium]|nr:anaerobic ribonucleoside-triphosphate reductase activating protein [Candidatus Gracilibacteria bacterium]